MNDTEGQADVHSEIQVGVKSRKVERGEEAAAGLTDMSSESKALIKIVSIN